MKWSYGFHSARTLTPAQGRRLIQERAAAALRRIEDFTPYSPGEGPVTLELSFKNYMPAELLGYLPNVERIDSHSVRFIGQDMVEVSKFIAFATSYRVDLTP